MRLKPIVLTDKSFAWLILLAASSLLCTLFLPSVGEEGVYTNITLEMMHNKNYLVPTLYGVQYSRPPLFNWLIMLYTQVLGPTHVVLAARLVNITATLVTAGGLIWFTRRIFAKQHLALLAAAVYLSGDLLFKRGWLAYADSLFSLFIFTAIVCLWLALEYKQKRWLLGAVISLSCGFLSKIHTVYVFYGIAGLVLLWQHPNRKYLFSPFSCLLHLLALAFPLYWTLSVMHGYGGMGTTWLQSQSFLAWPGLLTYAQRILITYPLDIVLRFLPSSIIAAYLLYKLRSAPALTAPPLAIRIIFWLTLLNLLPYWLVPTSNIRYILPLYPFIALLIAYVIWQASDAVRKLAVHGLLAAISLNFVYACWWLPYEHTAYRGNAATAAQQILTRTANSNLYINDSTSAGLRVAVELNKLRYPSPPLTVAPAKFTGYVLADNINPPLGELVKIYELRHNKLYLFFNAGTG